MFKHASADPAFSSFYESARDRLLLQTWAVTGDLSAAQKAVRDAFVIGSHHWRKLSRLPGPETTGAGETQEDWLRPVAWSRAQGRRSLPGLGRTKGLHPEVVATLDALGQLPKSQRKVLVLAHLSGVSLEQLAKEVGIPRSRAEQELRQATTTFCQQRQVAPEAIVRSFEPMAAEASAQEWPSIDQISRAGSNRRRGHTLIGAAATLIALIGSGLFVTSQADSAPMLKTLSFGSSAPDEAPAKARDDYPLGPSDLLTPQDVNKVLDGKWTTEITSDNRGGSGLVLPCQQRQFAAGDSVGALARTFQARTKNVTAGEAVEASPTTKRAKARFDSALSWYGACVENRVQLMSTQEIKGIGDEAALVALRDWGSDRSVVMGVARSGAVTTSVSATMRISTDEAIPKVTRLLGKAVDRTSELPDTGDGVAKKTKNRTVAPLPIGNKTQMLAEVDLPPVGSPRPWAGTKPQRAKTNLAATGCDETKFGKNGMEADWTRTFVIPGSKNLNPAFGLTQSVGTFSKKGGADAFMKGVRQKLESCSDRKLGSDVTPLGGAAGAKDRDSSTWRVEVVTGENSSVTYLMGIVRQGTAVTQIGFVPSGDVTMSSNGFRAVVTRAAERLRFS